jgi:hypothetical protein
VAPMTSKYKVKVIVLSFFFVAALFLAGCGNKHQAEPVLKIITVESNRLNLNGTREYYVAYGDGKIEKTSEFVPSDTVVYYFVPSDRTTDYLPEDHGADGSVLLKNVDVNTSQGKELNEFANNILLLLDEENLKIVSVNRLFPLGGQYFFDILYDDGKRENAGCKLFAYIPSDNRIEEVVDYNSKSIEHIELYDSR